MENPKVSSKTISFDKMSLIISKEADLLRMEIKDPLFPSKIYKTFINANEIETLSNGMFHDLESFYEDLNINAPDNNTPTNMRLQFSDRKLNFSIEIEILGKRKCWKFSIPFEEVNIDPLNELKSKISEISKEMIDQGNSITLLKEENNSLKAEIANMKDCNLLKIKSLEEKIELIVIENKLLKDKAAELEVINNDLRVIIDEKLKTGLKKKESSSEENTESYINLNIFRGWEGHHYCGRKGLYKCYDCDGTCGPDNGCNCTDCLNLDLKLGIGPSMHCPKCKTVPLFRLENASLYYFKKSQGNCRCNACFAPNRTLVMHCTKCEYDLCADCWKQVKR